MKRRRFAVLSGFGITALALPAACYNPLTPAYDPLLAQPELLSQIWEPETLVEIGALYRNLTPGERTEEALVAVLFPEAPGTTDSTVEWVKKRIRDDFREGDLVMLDGWMLSRTEARQCALFSIRHAR
ncbi:hypothetical protein [Robiginitalea marina]|uniref:Uncharacterized protein n=1 Tax=Robiginitalea marina TaxID=2954105 RepID=A0ABT1B2F5_9FLAO|nr:hypothetical protein [Robiginitalea marina]MCO5726030.1 hypothetical protein [Robiginitalea marina]